MNELAKQIQQALRKLGFWVEAGLREGVPELLVVAPCYGWLLVGEEAELSPDLSRWLRRARAAGLRVALVTSVAQACNQAVSWRAEVPVRRGLPSS